MSTYRQTFVHLGLFAALASTAAAQSEVVGLDIRNDQYFSSSTVSFVNSFTTMAPETRRIFGLDWTADGSTLYGIDRDSLEVVTFPPVSSHSSDTTNGQGALIGPTGFDANFAQGMDFDPATGDLVATIYLGSGVGQYCTIDLTSIPQPNGSVAAATGDTWNFQTWYRDSNAMGPGSNFTNGLEISFN